MDDLISARRRIKQLEAEARRWEAWAKKAKARIAELEQLVDEVRDHVDPAKKDIVLAAQKAKSWAARAVKILKKLF